MIIEMTTMERRAQQLIKLHCAHVQLFRSTIPSYQEMKDTLRFSGFMECYLRHSKNDQTMTSTADYSVTLELARIDQSRNPIKFCNSRCKTKLIF